MNDVIEAPLPKPYLKRLGWIFFGLACILVFTLAKFPTSKLKSTLHSELSSQLAAMGIRMNAGESDLSLLFGVRYVMKDVRLYFHGSSDPVRLERVSFSPSLLGLISGSLGGSASLELGGGDVDLSFSMSKDQKQVDLTFDMNRVDFGKVKILEALSPVKGSFIADVSASLSGNPMNLSTFKGDASMKVQKLEIPAQKLVIPGLFFSPEIPSTLRVKEGSALFKIRDGRVSFKNVKLGDPQGKDADLYLSATGEIILQNTWDTSKVDLQVFFNLFGDVKKSFALLDTLLKTAKRKDGSFGFTVKGPASYPEATPMTDG